MRMWKEFSWNGYVSAAGFGQCKGTQNEPTSMQSDEEVPMVRDEVRLDLRDTACSALNGF